MKGTWHPTYQNLTPHLLPFGPDQCWPRSTSIRLFNLDSTSLLEPIFNSPNFISYRGSTLILFLEYQLHDLLSFCLTFLRHQYNSHESRLD